MKKTLLILVVAALVACFSLPAAANDQLIGEDAGASAELSGMSTLSGNYNYTLGSTVNGSVTSTVSENYYRFTLPSSGRVNLKFLGYMSSINMKIYDSENTEVWSIFHSWDSSIQQNIVNENIDLIKGTYRLKIEKRYDYTGSYSFSLNFTSANESFSESIGNMNNSITTPSRINLDTNYNGQIASNDDDDFYSFTLPTSGRINLKFLGYIKSMRMRIYDSAGTQVWSVGQGIAGHSWDEKTRQNIANENIDLMGGNYYLKIEKFSTHTGPYSFSLSFTSANESFTETIDNTNNSITTPSNINLNIIYNGQIACNDDDDDFYSFTIPSSRQINIRFLGYMQEISIRIYDSASTQVWSNRKSWDKTTQQNITNEIIDLSGGDYRLKVEKSRSYTGPYSFIISDGSAVINPDTPTSQGFSDVPGDSWFAPYVYDLAGRGIINGMGNNTFVPNGRITRAEFAKILAFASGENLDGYEGKTSFGDVPVGQWFSNPIEWAFQHGIVQGKGNGYAPGENITRQEMAVMIVRYASYKGTALTQKDAPITFADNAHIATWAKEAVAAMQQAGIINGVGNNRFAPTDSATRAQAAKMISVFLTL